MRRGPSRHAARHMRTAEGQLAAVSLAVTMAITLLIAALNFI